MDYKTIGDVYAANDQINQKFVETVKDLTDGQANLPTENGKWNVHSLIEHVAMVHHGMTSIAAKLLSKAEAEGAVSDGSIRPSSSFLEAAAKAATEKYEAPEMVAPTGKKTIAEALAALEVSRTNLSEIRSKFESIDGTGFSFPHPIFGALNAHDWLILIGGHVARHNSQIVQILSRK